MTDKSSMWHKPAPWRRQAACLVVLLAVIPFSVPAGASGDAWSVSLPEEANHSLTVGPDTTVLTGNCTEATRSGGVVWQLPNVLGRTPSCLDAVEDDEGNAYVLTEQAGTANSIVESLTPTGGVRWFVTVGEYTATALGKPVIGANGSVFFSLWNGGQSKVMGFNEQTGAITLQQQFDYVTGLHAYSGGLIVVDTDSQVIYLGYDGTVLAQYSTGSPISAYEAYSNASGAGGTLFVAGYGGGCSSGSHASVEKFAPGGLAWTWTDKATYCAQTSLTATPDGGVIFARSETNPSADFTSLSATGTERWTDNMMGAIGPADNAGYFPVRVDVNGVVALPATNIYRCPVQPEEHCVGAQIELVSTQTGAEVYEPLQLQGSGEYGFDLYDDAIGAERLYVTGEVLEPSVTETLDAFSIPGLGEDYQVALQEQLTGQPSLPPPAGNGGGGKPTSGGGGGGGAFSPPPVISACKPVRGSLLKRILAGLRCKAAEALLDAKCAVAVASLVAFPLKLLKIIKAAKSTAVLAKVPKKLRGAAKLLYDIAHYKVLPKAPPGYRTVSEIIGKLKNARTALVAIKTVPDLLKAFARQDVSTIALDLDNIAGLHACVQVAANAGAP